MQIKERLVEKKKINAYATRKSNIRQNVRYLPKDKKTFLHLPSSQINQVGKKKKANVFNKVLNKPVINQISGNLTRKK